MYQLEIIKTIKTIKGLKTMSIYKKTNDLLDCIYYAVIFSLNIYIFIIRPDLLSLGMLIFTHTAFNIVLNEKRNEKENPWYDN